VQELAGRYGIPIPEEDPGAAARAQAQGSLEVRQN